MRLFEAEAKALLQEHGVAVPFGVWVTEETQLLDALATVGRPAMLKAQVLSGGRHKDGLIRALAESDPDATAVQFFRRVVGGRDPCAGVLVERRVEHSGEMYLLLDVDDLSGDIRCWTSASGGVDIEQNAGDLREAHFPADEPAPRERILASLDPRLAAPAAAAAADAAAALVSAMRGCDAEIVEINPLGLTNGTAMVLDAKVTIDDNATYRQQIPAPSLSPRAANVRRSADALSERAHVAGLTYLPLDGDIALLSMGAGFGMAVMDLVAEHGGRLANFIDTSGGVSVNAVRELADIVLCRAREVGARSIIISFVIAASSLRNVIEGIVAALSDHPERPPIFSTFNAGAAATVSMSYDEAVEWLESAGVHVSPDLPDTVSAAVACGFQSAR
ncbi:hypothetical protein K6U06_05910 [Acidiferrimicrobium sp. IK]|uniref:ATP-grasp domain-containing protein n=1 Tax=Acidiferrimicrobium sp. IK TaxID=2871700 RepID=UPI0021CB2FB1|nr:ATP-grasp domain-containing protein [Acidiferrimicrobium sp. IK]MCU4183888.1 hypothetical protein [Acidiferrimicrobium sp. IK]